MRDFLRKKRHTDTAEPDTAPDTASIRTPAETTAPERKHRQWYLRFARQQLLGWSPIITGNLVIAYLFATAVLCFALGLPILLASTSLPVYAVRYDNASPFSSPNSLQKQQLLESYRGEGAPVSVVMTVRKRMTQPVRPVLICPCSSANNFLALESSCMCIEGCLKYISHRLHVCQAVCTTECIKALAVTCSLTLPSCRCTYPLSWGASTRITNGALCTALAALLACCPCICSAVCSQLSH